MNTTTAIRHILVPHDFGDPSAAALTYAEHLARALGARITLLHVVEDPAEGGDDAAELVHQLAPALREHVSEVLLDALETVASRARGGGVAVAAKVRVGRPWCEIDAEAAEGGFDLIVMGTHGRHGLARGLLGSVAEKVVRTAPCPVLTVHAAEQLRAA
jgi:nucleotide-binding universal stress UspA family protein